MVRLEVYILCYLGIDSILFVYCMNYMYSVCGIMCSGYLSLSYVGFGSREMQLGEIWLLGGFIMFLKVSYPLISFLISVKMTGKTHTR